MAKAVPKNRFQAAKAFAGKFEVKKHTPKFKGQHDSLAFIDALEKKHLLKSHLNDLPTYTSTKKQILEEMTGTKVKPPDPQVEAREARRKLKEEGKKMQAKTSSEQHQAPKDKKPLTEARRADNVVAGRESSEMVEAEIAKRSGKKTNAAGAKSETRPNRGGVTLAPDTIVLPRRAENKMPALGSLPSLAASDKISQEQDASFRNEENRDSAAPDESEGVAPLEPGNPDEAIDIGI
jgi:hypothetical protein